MAINKREVIAFTAPVGPGESITLKERIKAAGTIEKLDVRFYPGQQRALQVLPIVMHGGNGFGLAEPIVNYSSGVQPGDLISTQYLAGDDDRLSFDTSIQVENDDEIWVTAINTDQNFAYDLVVYVMVDYLGGTMRA